MSSHTQIKVTALNEVAVDTESGDGYRVLLCLPFPSTPSVLPCAMFWRFLVSNIFIIGTLFLPALDVAAGTVKDGGRKASSIFSFFSSSSSLSG